MLFQRLRPGFWALTICEDRLPFGLVKFLPDGAEFGLSGLVALILGLGLNLPLSLGAGTPGLFQSALGFADWRAKISRVLIV